MYLVRSSFLAKRLYPKALWRENTVQKKLFLTFDDGPVQGITDFVLDTLKKNNLKATFFCVGENIQKNPSLYQRIIEEGHVTGNHTFNHVNGWNTHTTDYLHNVAYCQKVLLEYAQETGGNDSVRAISLFRPPYGRLKRSQYRSLVSNYKIVMWDVLSGDYDRNTSPEKCLSNVVNNARNGSVIVFHDSAKAQRNMEYALPRFIEDALAKGYKFDVLK
jgi:peptidoglycan-N-acetylglucosamine deacetylase